MLCIYLLGGFRVEIDSEPLQLPKVQGLVELWAYLVLHLHRPIQRDQLAFMLWPDESEESARAQLRSCLFKLRKLLPVAVKEQPWLLTQGRTLLWNPAADYWLDVEHFKQEVEGSGGIEYRDGYDELTPEQKIATLELYSGDLLPELNSDWLLPIRLQLRDEYLARLDRLMETCVSQGEASAALVAARKAARIDSYSEAALRRLMRLRYLLNDRSGALCQFDDYLAFLKRSGSAPQLSAETLALRDVIASGVGAKRPAESEQLSMPNRRMQNDLRANKALRIILSLCVPGALIAGLLAALWYFHPFAPLRTLTLRGPQAVQDTWITSSYPNAFSANDSLSEELNVDLHDGRGWIVPQLPFSQYPAVRINLGNINVADTLLYFHLDTLPPGGRVEKAALTIYLEPGFIRGEVKRQPRPITLAAYRLLRSWEVDTATFSFPWSEAGLKPGVDYAAQPLCQQAVASGGALELDLSSAFPAWQNGQNFGVILMAVEAPAGMSAYWILSSEHPDPTVWPELTIQYR
jgi:DNA-binding SARP family transcriptional activator